MWRAQVPRALTGSPPSPQPRALGRRAQVPSTDKPSATPVGLDTQDPGSERSVSLRAVGSDDRARYTDWANNLTKVNPEALEKGTHPRNHQVGGLPWTDPTLRTCDPSSGRPPTIRMRTSTGRARSRPGHSQAYWGCLVTASPCASPCHCFRALGSGARRTRPRIRSAWRAGRP